jgi:yeast amino acid transporter
MATTTGFTDSKDGTASTPAQARSLSHSSAQGSAESIGRGDHAHGTKRGIKSRHAQMLAIGGTIGTGLFVGTGQALALCGPAFLFCAYLLICILVYSIATATTEMATYMPLRGTSMAYYANRLVSPSLGFALGWLYWYTWSISVAYEITAAAVVVDYWPNDVHVAVWISIMMVVVIALNFFPVRIYGETEFWFASIKIFTIIGLLILSVVLFFGGGPNHQRLGFWYWQDPGATKEYLVKGSAGRFCAFLYACVYSCFSFNFAPELLVLTAGEMEAPRKNLPKAAMRFFWRLILFYALGALAISVICRSDADGLTAGGSGAAASPWVIGIKNAGIRGLDSVINAVIITTAWSSANSILYMSSRTLMSMAVTGNAPRIFARCNRYGVPYYAVMASSLFAPFAYLSVGSTSSTAFNWFISIVNTSGFISWVCCCLIFFQFRRACAAQGIAKSDLPYTSKVQPYGAWVGLFAFGLFGLLNGFSVFFPGKFTASGFITSYLGIPVFFILYIGHRIYTRKDPWVRPPLSVDLQSGLDDVIAVEEEAEAAAQAAAANGEKKKELPIPVRKVLLIFGWE